MRTAAVLLAISVSLWSCCFGLHVQLHEDDALHASQPGVHHLPPVMMEIGSALKGLAELQQHQHREALLSAPLSVRDLRRLFSKMDTNDNHAVDAKEIKELFLTVSQR